MTSMPSLVPSSRPSQFPTTNVPSARPSISGWVVVLTTSTTVETLLDDTVVNDYVTSVASYYGVNESDVTPSVSYNTGGNFVLKIPDDATSEDVVEAVVESVAASLDIHPSSINVFVDMANGVVSFTVTSEDYIGAAEAAFDLATDAHQSNIISSIGSLLMGASVETYDATGIVEAIVEFTVDADDALEDLTAAAFEAIQFFENEGFGVEIESNFVFTNFYNYILYKCCCEQVISHLHQRSCHLCLHRRHFLRRHLPSLVR